jgi:diaminopimelate decarboxylase
LHCDSVPIPSLAKRVGTPFYLYSASTIRQRLKTFDEAFRGIPHTICYSVKANSNLSLLQMLADSGCGFDVVSGGELERVLTASPRAAKSVVFSGVGKTSQEMELALRSGILLFNVESEGELKVLSETAERLKKTANIALRVNPDVDAETHPYISTGLHEHKFGIPIRLARRLYAEAAKMRRLRVCGVSVHIGSQITTAAPFAQAMQRIAELVRDLRRDGHRIIYVDAGGGLGISYERGDLSQFPQQASRYAEALTSPLRPLNLHLLLEPGRSIVGPAGALVTRVLYVKQNDGKRFIIVDAAMNDLLRPALYKAFHEIVPVQSSNNAIRQVYDVVGPICETGDFFARERKLPRAAEGDLLAILDAGAYGMALASSYNSRPRAAEVLVDGKSVRVIRRRETVKDLLRQELT